MQSDIRVVLVGDVVGRSGRRKLEVEIERIWNEHSPDVVIVNIENAAGGFGITKKIYDHFIKIGVNVMTSGNHIYDNRDIVKKISDASNLLRPANYPEKAPGKGVLSINAGDDRELLIVNLQGRVFMPCINCPFEELERILDRYEEHKNIIVDFHGEATAEKQAFAHHFDGRVSAIIGTHTHVATMDARILPGGTGYITDVGMCGVIDSVIGMEKKPSIDRFLTMTKLRYGSDKFGPAKGDSILQGVVVDIDGEGFCSNIKHIEIR